MPSAWFQLAFLCALIASCAFAVTWGGRAERAGAAIMAVAAIASVPAAVLWGSLWGGPEIALLAVDIVTLAALLFLALKVDRTWPLWATASQLIAVVTHLAIIVTPIALPRAYSMAQPFWAYPALLALVTGTWTHRRRMTATIMRS